MDTLAYSVELENKDYLGTEIDDQQLASLLRPSNEESAEMAGKEKAVQITKSPAAELVDFETIDNKNQVQLESEAAISDVEVNEIANNLLNVVKDPLQPSKEASVLLFGEDITPPPRKPQKPLSVAEVVKKTLDMQKKKDSDAEDLFKAMKPVVQKTEP